MDPHALRRAFGSFLTGVTVVTMQRPDGVPLGFTANSFASVSLSPPLLLVCPGRHLSTFADFTGCHGFGVSILAEGQEDVSTVFARSEPDRFARVAWHPDSRGRPRIDGAAAWFSCRTHQVVEAGDHAILMGEVQEFAQSGAPGLGFSGGRYFSLELERAAAAPAGEGLRSFAGAIVSHGNRVLLVRSASGLRLPQLELRAPLRVRDTLLAWLASQGVTAQLGQAYSIYADTDGSRRSFFLARSDRSDGGRLGRFVPLDDLPGLALADPAEATMLDRFRRESAVQAFGLYIGDAADGDVHRP